MTAALEAIPAIERLEALTERLLDAESWEEVLAGWTAEHRCGPAYGFVSTRTQSK
jgi:hypothetical protein